MADQEIPEDFASIFVTNLPDDEETIRTEFGKYGQVVSVRLLSKKDDQDTRAGVITMSTGAEAREVMDKLKGASLGSGVKRLRLTWDSRSLDRFNTGRYGGRGFRGSFGGSSSFSFSKGNTTRGFTEGTTPLNVQPAQHVPVIRNGTVAAISVEGHEYVALRLTASGKEIVAGYVLASLYSALEKSSTSLTDAATPPREDKLSRLKSSAPVDGAHDPEERNNQRPDSGVASAAVSPVIVRQPPVVMEKVEPPKDGDVSFAGVRSLRKNQFGVATSSTVVSTFLPPAVSSPSVRIPKKLALRSLPAFLPGVLMHPGTKNTVKEREDFNVCIRHIFPNFEAAVWTVEKGQVLIADSEPLAFVANMSRQLKDFYEGFDARPYPVEPNQPVSVCIDNVWYRAKCTAEKSSSDLVVFLVDEGVEREATQETTFPLDEQFGKEPVGAVVVGLIELPSVEQHPNLLDELRNLLQGKAGSASSETVDATIVMRAPEYQVRLAIEDIPLKTILLAKRLRKDGHEVGIGYLLNVTDAVNVFIVDVSKKDELVQLQRKVNEALSSSQLLPESVARDAPVGVFFDDEWYRGLVDKVTGSFCQGTLLDFGDSFTVPVANLKGLSEEVQAIAAVTDMSALKNVPAPLLTDARITDQLKRMVSQYWVYEEFGRDTNFPLANFIHLWNAEGQLVPVNMPPVPELPKSIVINENYNFYVSQLKYEREFKTGDEIPVGVQYVSDPEFVYLLYGKDLLSDQRVQQLASDLQTAGQTAPKHVDMPAEGALVIGRFSLDNAWYRAAVTGFTPTGKAQVTYIDYGNEEELSLEDMRSMTPLLMSYPRMVFQAGLGNIQPLNGEYFTPEEIDQSTALLVNQQGTFKVLLNEDDSIMLGVLRMEGSNCSAADLMAKAGIVKKVK
ncbi:hypothetical protein RvY_12808 [Ramazzottius varieornatus]|uniref:Tudor domain-containing protein n=1 Tax=Ramazzottius varieornatus TaxID=947166 RepID=A0A1D1VTC3_RAMVA|nr:hypothetical protein RvY_12808 [Ramazzottius varieornatus]